MKSDVTWQNYLNDASEAIVAGKTLEPIRKQYAIDSSEDSRLIAIIEDLNEKLVEVKPSAQFSKNLKAELLGMPQDSVVWQIRKLPARVQIAAIIAAVLGGLGGVGGALLILQRVFSEKARAAKAQAVPDES